MNNEYFDLKSVGVKKEKLAHDILHSFHTQFAENQRTREQAFLKILGFLGFVIFGYAYVYDRLSGDIDKFTLVAITSELLLMFGALIITTIAYNFRRDQYINAKIRRSCAILGDDKIFPEGYDPSVSLKSRKRILTWMPDFLSVFYWVFPTFQLLLFISYAFKLRIYISMSDADAYVTTAFIAFIISISITIGYNIFYFIKLRKILGIADNSRKKKGTTPSEAIQ